jgi:ATP-binding cassette subfamily F protein uup
LLMTAPALITLTDVHLAYGHHPLLAGVNLAIQKGERIGLIGRNGTGKSSLLHLLSEQTQPDAGRIMRASTVSIATSDQEPKLDSSTNVFELVNGPAEDEEDWQRLARVHTLLTQLDLPAHACLAELSGGMRKRVALARALVSQANVLLLDEPTNHLDFEGITWLEQQLASYPGSLVIITHDRRFLDNVVTRIVELDRGQLLSFPGNFSQWQVHKAQWLVAQKLEQARADKLLAKEEIWIRQGVQARRTRDEGRVRRLEQLRQQRAQRRDQQGNVKLALTTGQRSGQLVAELKQVSQSFGEHVVVHNYSTTVLRGDRIGIIGANGAGKTTLLRILLGQLQPDHGVVRLGTNVTVAYFDQLRTQLQANATLADVISPGSEWIEIGDQRKHVMSYLGDFLFSPARANSPVKSLSGGERARLLLARLFAQPANVLVLDEPTNDLDVETLELLEALLQEYRGTVLLVSHDREFLNNVVTQIIANDGPGIWNDYVGGYDDWVAQRPPPQRTPTKPVVKTNSGPAESDRAGPNHTAPTPTKPGHTASDQTTTPGIGSAQTKPVKLARLSSWEVRELATLPDIIAALEAEQATLSTQLADQKLYRGSPDEISDLYEQLDRLEKKRETQYARWEALEARQTGAKPQ